jgi:hypothetical protein
MIKILNAILDHKIIGPFIGLIYWGVLLSLPFFWDFYTPFGRFVILGSFIFGTLIDFFSSKLWLRIRLWLNI